MPASHEEHLASVALSAGLDDAVAGSSACLIGISPELADAPEAVRDACSRDIGHYIRFLTQALATGRPALFVDQIIWADQTLTAIGLGRDCLTSGLGSIGEWAAGAMEPELAAQVVRYLETALAELAKSPVREPQSLIDPLAPCGDLATRYLAAVLSGDRLTAMRVITNASDAGVPVHDLYLHVFQPVLQEVGRLWQTNRITVADEHYITAVTQTAMSQLYPRFMNAGETGKTMLGASVGGEHHEIGVRMVADFFELDGWDTYYLGADVPDAALIDAVERYDPDLIGLSATIGYHVGRIAELVQLVREHPRAGRVKIIVGGYPFNEVPDLWRDVGADGSARDAGEAVQVGRQLVYLPT